MLPALEEDLPGRWDIMSDTQRKANKCKWIKCCICHILNRRDEVITDVPRMCQDSARFFFTVCGRYPYPSDRLGSLLSDGGCISDSVLCNSQSPLLCTAWSSHVNQVNFPIIKWEKPKLGCTNKMWTYHNIFARALKKQSLVLMLSAMALT